MALLVRNLRDVVKPPLTKLAGGLMAFLSRPVKRPRHREIRGQGGLMALVIQNVQGGAALYRSVTLSTQPSSTATSGTAFAQQPVFQLAELGVPVATASVTITVGIVSGSGTLSGTATLITNASGKATATNLAITGTGAHTIGGSATAYTRIASNSITVSTAGNALSEPVYASFSGTKKLHLFEDWSTDSAEGMTVAAYGSTPRYEGPAGLYRRPDGGRGHREIWGTPCDPYTTVRNDVDGFGSARSIRIMKAVYPAQRGFGIRDPLNLPELGSVVYEFSTRYGGTPPYGFYYHGKLFDINASGAGDPSGMGRWNYDPYAWHLGKNGGPCNSGEDANYCPIFYTNNGATPLYAELPTTSSTSAPAFARQSSWQTAYGIPTVIIYKQDTNFGTGAGQFDFLNNFDLRGIGTHPTSNIWLKTKIRLTVEPTPYVAGRGRVEVWVGTVESGTTEGSMVKVMDLIGDDPTNRSFGKVWVVSSNAYTPSVDVDCAFTTDQSQAAGLTNHDWGLLRMWSHDRIAL